MDDPWLAEFTESLIRREVIPALGKRCGFDLEPYASDVLHRFRNPAIGHKLAQIAWDGSQKLPYRLLDSIADARSAGLPFARLAKAVAAWMRFVQRRAQNAVPIVDPLGDRLAALGGQSSDDLTLLDSLLDLREIFPAALASDGEVRAALRAGLATLEEKVNA